MKNDNQTQNNEPYTGRTYAYIAIGSAAASAVFFGLAFTVMGIYSLIASTLLSLASLSFANVQKKKNNFKQLIIIKVFAYILLALNIAFFTGGIIWASME